jgi:hypothetical protein
MEFPWFLVWCHPMTCGGSETCTRDSDRVNKLMKDHSVTNSDTINNFNIYFV